MIKSLILVITAGRANTKYRLCAKKPNLRPNEFAYKLIIPIPDGWRKMPEIRLPEILPRTTEITYEKDMERENG